MNTDPLISFKYFGGNCPVQAEGTVDEAPFYFRARGGHWSMSIGGADVIGNPEWYHEEPYGEQEYAAGWMPQWEALGLISKAIGMYATQEQTAPVESVADFNPSEAIMRAQQACVDADKIAYDKGFSDGLAASMALAREIDDNAILTGMDIGQRARELIAKAGEAA